MVDDRNDGRWQRTWGQRVVAAVDIRQSESG